jgi:hypothetical protein
VHGKLRPRCSCSSSFDSAEPAPSITSTSGVDGKEFAVKVSTEHWTADEARSAFEVLEIVREALDGDDGVAVPRAYGWDSQVPALCMSWKG